MNPNVRARTLARRMIAAPRAAALVATAMLSLPAGGALAASAPAHGVAHAGTVLGHPGPCGDDYSRPLLAPASPGPLPTAQRPISDRQCLRAYRAEVGRRARRAGIPAVRMEQQLWVDRLMWTTARQGKSGRQRIAETLLDDGLGNDFRVATDHGTHFRYEFDVTAPTSLAATRASIRAALTALTGSRARAAIAMRDITVGRAAYSYTQLAAAYPSVMALAGAMDAPHYVNVYFGRLGTDQVDGPEPVGLVVNMAYNTPDDELQRVSDLFAPYAPMARVWRMYPDQLTYGPPVHQP